jgi:outer membrane lipoprotein carrier protein
MKARPNTMYSRLKKLTTLTALSMLSLFANASAIEEFKIFLGNTKSAKGEFAQVQLRSEGVEKMRMGTPTTGIFLFSKPGKFIWAYKKPYEQILQSDGQMLYIHDKDLNQVTVRKLDQALGGSPAAILFGSTDIEKGFNLAESGTKGSLKWMEATPKDQESIFLRINIAMKDNIPVAMELYDTLGQASLIKFTAFERNPALKADAFHFVMPKGVDIFRN